jgi:hypothetical protein
MNTSRASRSPLATWCSLIAAAACATISLSSVALPQIDASRAWIFLVAAAAFASNLTGSLHPSLRGLAALVEAVGAFELLGFCVGLTVLAFAGSGSSPSLPWWALGAGWGALVACFGAAFAAATSAVRSFVALNPP